MLSVLLCAGLVSVLAGCGSDDAKKIREKRFKLNLIDYAKEKGTLVVESKFWADGLPGWKGEWISFDADMAKAFGETSA